MFTRFIKVSFCKICHAGDFIHELWCHTLSFVLYCIFSGLWQFSFDQQVCLAHTY